MLRFNSLGDGNCFYNTEAVWLVYAFQQGLLKPLYNDIVVVQQLGMLLRQVSMTSTINLSNELGERYTARSIQAAFKALIRGVSTDEGIDWIKLQEVMSSALRAHVVDTIENQSIADEGPIKNELSRALDQSISMSTYEEPMVSYHFEELEIVKEKITEILLDDTLATLPQKQAALRTWFFDGDRVGLNNFLYHPEVGIASDGVYAGAFEMKILSCLFRHEIGVYWSGNPTSNKLNLHEVINRFNDDVKRYSGSSLAFKFEKTGMHWNALLPRDPLSQKVVKANQIQIKKHAQEQNTKEKTALLPAILETYGSFCEHHKQEMPEITASDYCQMLGITKEKYEAAGIKQSQINLKDKATSKPKSILKPQTILGSQVNSKPEVNPKTKATSITQNVQSDVAVTQKSPSKEENQSEQAPKLASPAQHTWLRYLMMVFAFGGIIAFAFHCFLTPFLLPIVESLVAGTLLASYIALTELVLTVAFSLTVGALLTRMVPVSGRQAKSSLPIIAQVTDPVLQSASNDNSNPLLMIYNNKVAQTQNRAKILENNEVLSKSRQRLH